MKKTNIYTGAFMALGVILVAAGLWTGILKLAGSGPEPSQWLYNEGRMIDIILYFSGGICIITGFTIRKCISAVMDRYDDLRLELEYLRNRGSTDEIV